jgi:hypothetical protein
MSSKHATQDIGEFLYFGEVLLFCPHAFVKPSLIQPNFIIILSAYLSISMFKQIWIYSLNIWLICVCQLMIIVTCD